MFVQHKYLNNNRYVIYFEIQDYPELITKKYMDIGEREF